jgi:ribosomal protein L24
VLKALSEKMGLCISRVSVVEQQNTELKRELGNLRERMEQMRCSNVTLVADMSRASTRATADAVEKLRTELRVEVNKKAADDMARLRADLSNKVVAEGTEKLLAELTKRGGAKPRKPTFRVPRSNRVAPEAIPSFECPISRDRMVDPVVAADGHTYERAGIETWLAKNSTSPMTREKLANRTLIPNHALRNAIGEASL